MYPTWMFPAFVEPFCVTVSGEFPDAVRWTL
jgi:hypothetical protein